MSYTFLLRSLLTQRLFWKWNLCPHPRSWLSVDQLPVRTWSCYRYHSSLFWHKHLTVVVQINLFFFFKELWIRDKKKTSSKVIIVTRLWTTHTQCWLHIGVNSAKGKWSLLSRTLWCAGAPTHWENMKKIPICSICPFPWCQSSFHCKLPIVWQLAHKIPEYLRVAFRSLPQQTSAYTYYWPVSVVLWFRVPHKASTKGVSQVGVSSEVSPGNGYTSKLALWSLTEFTSSPVVSWSSFCRFWVLAGGHPKFLATWASLSRQLGLGVDGLLAIWSLLPVLT